MATFVPQGQSWVVTKEMMWPAKPKLFSLSLPTPDIDRYCYDLVNYITLLYFKDLHNRFDIQPGDAHLYINGLHVDKDAYDPFR